MLRVRIRDPESFLSWIRDKHPGSATLHNFVDLDKFVSRGYSKLCKSLENHPRGGKILPNGFLLLYPEYRSAVRYLPCLVHLPLKISTLIKAVLRNPDLSDPYLRFWASWILLSSSKNSTKNEKLFKCNFKSN